LRPIWFEREIRFRRASICVAGPARPRGHSLCALALPSRPSSPALILCCRKKPKGFGPSALRSEGGSFPVGARCLVMEVSFRPLARAPLRQFRRIRGSKAEGQNSSNAPLFIDVGLCPSTFTFDPGFPRSIYNRATLALAWREVATCCDPWR